MSAAIFGNFSSIMMRMYQGSEEMQQKTRSIKDFISFHTIPDALSKRMHDAFLHSWSDTNGIDMNSVSVILLFTSRECIYLLPLVLVRQLPDLSYYIL